MLSVPTSCLGSLGTVSVAEGHGFKPCSKVNPNSAGLFLVESLATQGRDSEGFLSIQHEETLGFCLSLKGVGAPCPSFRPTQKLSYLTCKGLLAYRELDI